MLVFAYDYGYLAELHSSTVEDILFWVSFEYISIPLLNSAWLIVSLLYLGRLKKLNLIWTYIIYIIPVCTIIARLTNDYHHLFYTDLYLVQLDTFYLLKTT